MNDTRDHKDRLIDIIKEVTDAVRIPDSDKELLVQKDRIKTVRHNCDLH